MGDREGREREGERGGKRGARQREKGEGGDI